MKIIFFGTPDFARIILAGLCEAGQKPVLAISQPDKAQGRKQLVKPTPVHQFCDANGIEHLQARKIKTADFYQKLQDCEPDFIVTAAYGRILPDNILTLPKYKALNVHASLLPKYRGASPVQASLIAGDRVTGVSILEMSSELDAGPIYRQETYAIPAGMRSDELMTELAKLGSQILPETLRGIEAGSITSWEQDNALATTVGLIDKSYGQINWHDSAFQIESLVRGLYPWPTAYTYEQGRRVKILNAKAWSKDSIPAEVLGNGETSNSLADYEAGSVVSLYAKSIWVKTGSGLLQLLEIQKENSRAMSTSECYHNYKVGSDQFSNNRD